METRIELNKNINLSERKELMFNREIQNDIVLPDYCDDINRIIRVDAKPIIKNKYANKDLARVNGIVAITVVYISDPHKQLRSFSFVNDFDYSLDMPGIVSNHRLAAVMEIGELNCRLLNPRKMTVRIDTGIRIKTNEAADLQEFDASNFYSPGELDEHDGMHIEKLRRTFEVCDSLLGDGEIKLEENIEITEGDAANEIIYADVCTVVDEVKALHGKAVIKFTSEIKLLYSSVEDRNKYIKISKEVSGTHIIDIDDLGEQYECTANISLSSLKTDIDIDQYGDNKMLNVDFVLQIEVAAYKNNEHEIVVDAYAPKFENSVSNEIMKVQRYKGIYRDVRKIEDSIELEESMLMMDEVMDIAGIAIISSVSVGDSGITIESSAELSVMVKGGEGEIQEIACSIPIKTDISTGEKIIGGTADVTGRILSVEAFIDAGKLTAKVSVSHECVVFENEVLNIARAVIVDPEVPKSGKKDVQMIIYYPGKSESLWSVAKKYDSQVSKIMKYNKLESQYIGDRKIIIVPRV